MHERNRNHKYFVSLLKIAGDHLLDMCALPNWIDVFGYIHKSKILWEVWTNSYIPYFLPKVYLGMPQQPRGTRSPRSLAIFSRTIPRWLENSNPSPPPSPPLFPEFPRKTTILTFSSFFWIFYKKMCDPHYIWLFLELILSFKIMKIILFFWFQKIKKIVKIVAFRGN